MLRLRDQSGEVGLVAEGGCIRERRSYRGRSPEAGRGWSLGRHRAKSSAHKEERLWERKGHASAEVLNSNSFHHLKMV